MGRAVVVLEIQDYLAWGSEALDITESYLGECPVSWISTCDFAIS